MLPLNEQVFAAARAARATYALESPDAIVLASVLTDLDAKRATSCFLNRNTKDFADPMLVGDLVAARCRVAASGILPPAAGIEDAPTFPGPLSSRGPSTPPRPT